jgi:hypothetical protein
MIKQGLAVTHSSFSHASSSSSSLAAADWLDSVMSLMEYARPLLQ